jgi:dihydrofolate reductase
MMDIIPGPTRIEGYAIVSADHMLADASGRMDGLIIAADQQFFQDGLDRAAVIVHGRHSHEGGPRAAGRRRLIVTTRVAALADDPAHPQSLLWNPKGAALAEAWARLGAPDGVLAVIGGPHVYGMFLDRGYDTFHLSRATNVRLPGGLPLFPGVGPNCTPEDLMVGHGLKPAPPRLLADGVTLTTWSR